MTKTDCRIIGLCLFLLMVASNPTRGAQGLEELNTVMDSARIIETPIFAPRTWEKALDKHREAMEAIKGSKSRSTIEKHIAEAREFTENAIKATEVGKLSLREYLPPREKAKVAGAERLVPELYGVAEEQFVKATAKVESGDVKGGLKEAEKSSPLFDVAELEATRADILGKADRLIEKALADDAGKFALSTLDKARSARDRGDAIIVADRYNREEAVAEAQRAEYEARHASNIGLSVRSLKRNDQAWEKLMLVYEIQMNRVGEALGADFLPFDNGPIAAADTLITHINELQTNNQGLSDRIVNVSSGVTARLKQAMLRMGASPSDEDPVAMAQMVDQRISELLAERDDLAQRVQSGQAELTELSREHEDISAELAVRTEREDKFKKAKTTLNPSEGEVLFNSSNDIVLRLSGLSFDIGKSEIKDKHVPLLEKVREIIEMFPESQLVVEGHTDASGDASANVLLSEKRAFAVMQYLRQSLLISAGRIQSIGYGADNPVASNKTADGRAKNRRIDIIIME